MSDPKDKGGQAGTDGNPKPDDDVKVTTVHKKIEVKIDRDPEITALQKELAEANVREEDLKKKLDADSQKLSEEKKELASLVDEYKAKEEKKSLEEFQKKKESLLNICKASGIKDEQMTDIEEKLASPQNITIVESLITMMLSNLKEEREKSTPKPAPTAKPAPSGKAPFTPPTNAEQFETDVEMLDELYDRAYYKKSQYTVQQQREAKEKIATLINTLIKSPSWMQLKKGDRPPMPNIISCPECHKTIVGDIPPKCPKCGFNFARTGDVLQGVG